MKKVLVIYRLIKDYIPYIAQSTMVSMLMIVLGIPGPYLSKMLLDDVYPTKSFSLLYILIIATVILGIFNSIVSFMTSYFTASLSVKMSVSVRMKFYSHLQSLKFSFYDEHKVGEVISRFGNLGTAADGIIGLGNTFIQSIFSVIIFVPIILFMSWKLTLMSFLLFPIEIWLTTYSAKKMKQKNKIAAEKNAENSAIIYETMNGIKTVKSIALEKTFYDKNDNAILASRNAGLISTLYAQIFGLIFTYTNLIGTSIYMFIGWSSVLNNEITLGSFIAFGSYLGYVRNPIKSLVGMISDYQNTMVHIDRFLEYYDTPGEQDGNNNTEIEKGEITFTNVTFGYESSKIILKNATFTIKSGEKYFIYGESGIGKTTLAHLIVRYYEPTEGEVFIDHINIKEYTLSKLRSQVVLVLQEPFLFRGTILDNMTMFCKQEAKELSQSAIMKYAEMCCLEDVMSKSSDFLSLELREKGQNLSQGQKQRLAILRALLMKPKILILDESTSAVDVKTENRLFQNILNEFPEMTLVLISHRIESRSLFNNVLELGKDGLYDRHTGTQYSARI